MSDPSPFISNGTCYYAAGEKSVSEVLACGNGALGTKNCCYPGDMCLEDSYCFAHVGNFTYIGGCTDPAYEDAACNKGKEVTHWERVSFCSDEEPDGPTFTILCGSTRRPPTPEEDDCSCRTDSLVLNDSYVGDVVSLPQSRGESVIWQPGHEPTASGESSSASETGPAATVTVLSGGDSAGNEDNEDGGGGQGGLSVGAKAGIGVGVSLAGLLVLGIMFLLWRRRRKGSGAAAETEGSGSGGVAELPVRAGTPPPGELEADASWSELDGAIPGAGRKSVETTERAGVRPGEVRGDLSQRPMSLASELP